jgi:L-iditol 2-dehydrogenase
MLIGIPEFDRVSFRIDRIRRKEITVINVRRQNRCGPAAVDMVASGKADINFMITHRFRIDHAKEAFETVAGYKDGVVKAMIEF